MLNAAHNQLNEGSHTVRRLAGSCPCRERKAAKRGQGPMESRAEDGLDHAVLIRWGLYRYVMGKYLTCGSFQQSLATKQWKRSRNQFTRSPNSMQVRLHRTCPRLCCRIADGVVDDFFVIAITDANFGRYEITPEDLRRVMTVQPKVKTALICIGEGAEATW